MLRQCVLAATGGILCFIGCGGPPPANTPTPVASADAGKAPDAPAAAAKWVLDYNESSGQMKIPLDGGATLVVGDGGGRWLAKEGSFESATTLIPEAVATAKKTNDGFRFVGKTSGAVYTAKDPLGPVTKASKGLDDAEIIAVGRDASLGVTHKGDMLRSTD